MKGSDWSGDLCELNLTVARLPSSSIVFSNNLRTKRLFHSKHIPVYSTIKSNPSKLWDTYGNVLCCTIIYVVILEERINRRHQKGIAGTRKKPAAGTAKETPDHLIRLATFSSTKKQEPVRKTEPAYQPGPTQL